jgi:hypothetical protein
MCGGSCCADCFVELLANDVPNPGSDICCPAGGSTICSSNKNQQSDDHCCWPDQECVNGECCSDGHQGAVICGGTCCPSVACCNGECCPAGQVCGTTPEGPACVSASRDCNNLADCYEGEVCHDGVCCAGDRVCSDLELGDFCCPVGEYCLQAGDQADCCAINTTCFSTWRGHRVRK